MKRKLINEVRKFQKIAGILKESSRSEQIIGFQEYSDDLGSFLNWLEGNYKQATTSDTSQWEEDESFYFDKSTLTLTLWNEEFDENINMEFAEYMNDLKDDIEWEEWSDDEEMS